MEMNPLESGIYSISEAAHYAHAPYQRLYAWFGKGALFRSDYAETDIEKSISFLDLIDAVVVCRFRENGISMQYVRKAFEALQADLNTAHPFCYEGFFTGSGEIYIKCRETLSEVLSGQVYDEQVISQYLETIEYDSETRLANRWRIAQGIVLDPGIAFGKPVLDSTRIPTYALARAYYANGRDEGFVADVYELKPNDVLCAVRFEGELHQVKRAA